MIALGIDPDLHYCGIAVVEDSQVKYIGITKISSKFIGNAAIFEVIKSLQKLKEAGVKYDLCVIESQKQYYATQQKRRATPDDLIKLATVSGAAAAIFLCPVMFLPKPGDWKGSVPKAIHQMRILERVTASWDAVDKTGIPPGRLTHCIDAVGLALWGLEQK